MFEKKTCLILGAGASHPYGFPTSSELRTILLGGLAATKVFEELGFTDPVGSTAEHEALMMESVMHEVPYLTKFRNIFRRSQRVSIDSFISGRGGGDDVELLRTIGKNAVAATILQCEKASRLDGDWYQWLLEFLLRKGKEFPANVLWIITFNYDRSLEYYLRNAFEASFGLGGAAATEMLRRIEFIHVYGDVGASPSHRPMAKTIHTRLCLAI